MTSCGQTMKNTEIQLQLLYCCSSIFHQVSRVKAMLRRGPSNKAAPYLLKKFLIFDNLHFSRYPLDSCLARRLPIMQTSDTVSRVGSRREKTTTPARDRSHGMTSLRKVQRTIFSFSILDEVGKDKVFSWLISYKTIWKQEHGRNVND